MNLALPVECAGVERGVDSEAFHEERVRLGVEIIAPLEGRMAEGDDRVLEAIEYAVVPRGIDRILPFEEGFVRGSNRLHAGGERAGRGRTAPGLGGRGRGRGFL